MLMPVVMGVPGRDRGVTRGSVLTPPPRSSGSISSNLMSIRAPRVDARSRECLLRVPPRERRFDRLRDEPQSGDGVEVRAGTRLVRAEAVSGLQQREAGLLHFGDRRGDVGNLECHVMEAGTVLREIFVLDALPLQGLNHLELRIGAAESDSHRERATRASIAT